MVIESNCFKLLCAWVFYYFPCHAYSDHIKWKIYAVSSFDYRMFANSPSKIPERSYPLGRFAASYSRHHAPWLVQDKYNALEMRS
jgi:hypothetical protein